MISWERSRLLLDGNAFIPLESGGLEFRFDGGRGFALGCRGLFHTFESTADSRHFSPPLDNDVTRVEDQLDGLRFAFQPGRCLECSGCAALSKMVVFVEVAKAELRFPFEI